MPHVHYKFSSKLNSDTVVFDGLHLTLSDLKRQIMGREKLRSGDCDLQITNAQTKEEYTEDEELIPRGSSVIVRRIPITGVKSGSNSKTRSIERSDVQLYPTFGGVKAMDDQSSSGASPLFSKMTNLAEADASEEDKIKALINQSLYEPLSYKKSGPFLPANYTCYRCGNAGHHIRNCPTSGLKAEHDKNFEAPLRLKKSTGIPRSFMVEVDDPNIKGAMLTNCGHYAIPAIHAKAYAIGKKEKPPFVPQEQPSTDEQEDPVPSELLCLICHDLLSDAVVIPCCGNSYCDDCIRTTLLDSEDHICPTCSQPDVSPDTLIANKFLRQAVNTFKKEQGHGKSLRGRRGTSQSQNPTQTPSPVPTPPPLSVQSQPQRPPQLNHSQQDPLLHRSQATDTPTSSQVCGAPPTETGPAPASNTASTSLQPVQSHLEIPDKEAGEKMQDDPVAAAPSVLVSHKDPPASAAASQVNHTPAVEQPQTVSVNLQQSSSGQAPRHPGPSSCWESSSSSSSACPTGGWSEPNTQQLPPSSSSSTYPAAPPPLFPAAHFRPFLAAQQPLSTYPPGYPPATPVWPLQTPQSAPIPSLCSSSSASSIPTLITKEWYMHQRKKNERSPHRGSTYARSSTRSNLKPSKSKSSRSYSHSSSRSRSRSRSQGKSKHPSPYSRHRNLHARSHSSQSYSYGYKRSPSPSSSSSSRVGHRSRSKSPSDHRKNRYHSRHHSKKSASSKYSSRKRGEGSKSEAGVSDRKLASYLYAQQVKQKNSVEQEKQCYQQWKQQYTEWCEKYFSSYFSHLQLPPCPPLPQWGDREESRNYSHANSESSNHLQGRQTAQMDDRSPPLQSSSDSCSTPSHSASDSRSTSSHSSSDNHSSPSRSSKDSRSPPTQSSSDSRSAPAEDGAQPSAHPHRSAEKYSHQPDALTKGSKDVELQERKKDGEPLITRKWENLSPLKHEKKSTKKHVEGGGEESSSTDAADSTDDCKKDKRRHNTGPNTCKDGKPVQDRATASEALESVQPFVKPDKRLDKDYKRKDREQRNLEKDKEWRRGKYSGSRQDVERRHKEKPSKSSGRADADRSRNAGGSKASESRSEKPRKRKGEDVDRSSVEAQSSTGQKTNISQVPETGKSEDLNPFDIKKPKTEKKNERKTWPPTERDIWEGGIQVKPQKKISININLDGKRKEDRAEKMDLSYLESMTAKTKEGTEKTGDGEEEKLNRGGVEVNEKKETSRDQEDECKEKIKADEREARQMREEVTFREHTGQMGEKIAGEKKEDREEEDFDVWHRVLNKQWEECDKKEDEVTNDKRRGVKVGEEEERRVKNDGGGQEMGELVAGTQKERAEGGSTCKEDRAVPPKEELMEWRMRKEEEEDTMRSQRSRNESHHDRPNTTVDDGSSCGDHQERKMVVKTLDEYTQDRAADREDKLVLIQVPRSKWEKEESQEEGEVKVQTDALAVCLPSSSVTVTAETPTDRETEGESEQQRHRERERDRARASDRERDREREKNSHRSAAPSSGKDRPDSTLSTEKDRERERRKETERPRDRERGRETERQRDRQRESTRPKERKGKEDRGGREREKERRHSSKTSHLYSHSTSHDTERRDRQRGGDQGSNKSSCRPGGTPSTSRGGESSTVSRAAELPGQHVHETYKDRFLDLKTKDLSHHSHNRQDPSGNCRRQDRPAEPHHSPPSFSQSRGKERDPLPSRMSSPGRELTQNKGRDESSVDKVKKEGKAERDNHDMVAERKKGGQWEGEANKLDRQTKWEEGRELEEGERPSSSSKSVSSSSSQESGSSSGDDRRKEWKKKQEKHRKEKRRAAPELLEEGELKKHRHKRKKSRKSRDGGEEESSGE